MPQIYPYQPEPVPLETEALPEYLERELRRISDLLTLLSTGQLDAVNVVPTNPRDGMIRLADGTNWNPGSGQGVYCYYGSAWNLLG